MAQVSDPSFIWPRTEKSQIHREKDDERARCSTVTVLCAVLALVFLTSTMVLASFIWGYSLGMGYNDHDNREPYRPDAPKPSMDWPEPSGSLYAHYKKASVASDHGMCSEIGRNVLMEGGNAVDAMIASLLCIGVVNPQSSGLGGGFIMTMYNASSGRCVSIDARETAPSKASVNMYVDDPSQSVTGYRAIAIPSELHGFWTVFNKFGSRKVSWRRLFEPSIRLAMEGFPVSSFLASTLVEKEEQIQAEPTLAEIFIDPSTDRVYEEGDILKRKTYGFTLQLLANSPDPVELFYKGWLARIIASEITENGGLIDLEDLSNYKTSIQEKPLIADLLSDYEMCGPPPPSSFAVTQSIIAVMAEFYSGGRVDLDDPLVYHRLIEAEKFAYAKRTALGDVDFVATSKNLVANMTTNAYAKWIASMIKDTAQPQEYYLGDMTSQKPDHGTSHVSIIDTYGNAVSCTSTINTYFGSKRASPTLGIIWNNEMDDFSTPGASNSFGFAPSKTNFIAPGKRPMSSMSPTVIYNKLDKKVKMVVGASGGSFIISSIAQTVVRTLLFNETVKEAVDAPRLHNQYLPHVTEYEQKAPKKLVEALVSKYKQSMKSVDQQKSAVQVSEVEANGFIYSNNDFRRRTPNYPTGF